MANSFYFCRIDGRDLMARKKSTEMFKKENNIVRIAWLVIEEFTRIEELCSLVSFFFSKLYDIETFRQKSKYFLISKQVVFFVLQRSLGKIEFLEKNLDYLISFEVADKKILDNLEEIKARTKKLEVAYDKNKIKEVVDKLEEIGKEVAIMKNDFKQQVVE
jgi:hypothetical protein